MHIARKNSGSSQSSDTRPRSGQPGVNQERVLHNAYDIHSTGNSDPGRSTAGPWRVTAFDDSPSLQTDLRIASRILRAMIAKIDFAAAKTGETAELLANLRVAVED
jgi:hypothetical protein